MFSTDPVPARGTSLCEGVHGTIVLLSHDVVDRTTWTKLGLLKKQGYTAPGDTQTVVTIS